MTAADLQSRASAGDVRAQVQLSARLDEAGRHFDALDWLARAAGARDPQAMKMLGLKLVLGRHAPCRPRDGGGLLIDAMNAGDGEAGAFLAVIAASGFFGPQNWAAALAYLQRSAELGWAPSRRQLEILGPLTEPDLAAWTSAPEAKVICEAPRLMALQGLASAAACDWIVEQSTARLVRAQVHDPRTGLAIMGRTRTNRIANFGLEDTCLLNLMIQARIASALGVPIAMMEAFAVLNYAPGEQASEHFDYLDPAVPAYAEEIRRVGQRVTTVLLYLNDDYEGGETAFPELDLRHRARKGDALVFFSVDASGRPDPRTLHAGRPPTAGVKWVLSQFVRDRPFVTARPRA